MLDLDASKRFYSHVLASFGFTLSAETSKHAFGALSIGRGVPPTPPLHFALLARTRDAVNTFHAAGVEAGYESNGAPGLREYAPDYYAAFLLDPRRAQRRGRVSCQRA